MGFLEKFFPGPKEVAQDYTKMKAGERQTAQAMANLEEAEAERSLVMEKLRNADQIHTLNEQKRGLERQLSEAQKSGNTEEIGPPQKELEGVNGEIDAWEERYKI